MDINKTNTLSKNAIIGAAAIIIAALLWSLDGVFIRPKLYALDAGLVVFLEHFLGFIVLSPFVFFNWKKIRALQLKDWSAMLWVCFFGGALGTVMITKAFFAAVDGQVTFATVVLLQKLQPVFALLLARLILGEKLSKRFYYWAVVAVVAAYFLAFGKSGLDLHGVNLFHSAAWLAFVAAFAFGSSTVFGKRVVNHLNFQSTTALRFGITSILMLIFVLFTLHGLPLAQITTFQWVLFLIIVFTSGAAAMYIYYFGLKRVTASVSSICELAWPLSAVFLDYILNGNTLNTIQIIAAIVLLVCFYGVVNEGNAREFTFKARVISGKGRGKGLGFPTANLDATGIDLSHGVYLAEVEVKEKLYKGLLHFGFKETFEEDPSLEIFIKGLSADIYGDEVRIRVLRKIREVKKFDNPEELQKQIEADVRESLSE